MGSREARKAVFKAEHMAVPRINLCSEKGRQQVLQEIKPRAEEPGLGPKSNLHKAL